MRVIPSGVFRDVLLAGAEHGEDDSNYDHHSGNCQKGGVGGGGIIDEAGDGSADHNGNGNGAGIACQRRSDKECRRAQRTADQSSEARALLIGTAIVQKEECFVECTKPPVLRQAKPRARAQYVISLI